MALRFARAAVSRRLMAGTTLAPVPTRCMSSPVTMDLIKDLRARTGSPIKDCKKALEDSAGDMDNALDWLRKKGLAAASKKAARSASNGLIGCLCDADRAVLVELNSETDFVARNDNFQALLSEVLAVADTALPPRARGEEAMAALSAATMPSGSTVEVAVAEAVGTIQENLVLRRAAKLDVSDDPELVLGAYMHGKVADGLAPKVCVVAMRSAAAAGDEGVRAQLAEEARRTAMHIVVQEPRYVRREEVPEEALAAERSFLTEQALASGKPEAVVEKMVQGRLNKFYEEICLLDQEHMIEEEAGKVGKHLEALGKQLGATVTVAEFLRFSVGETGE